MRNLYSKLTSKVKQRSHFSYGGKIYINEVDIIPEKVFKLIYFHCGTKRSENLRFSEEKGLTRIEICARFLLKNMKFGR